MMKQSSVQSRILYDKKLIAVRVLIVISALLGLIPQIYRNASFSLDLAAFQHIVCPLIVTLVFLSKDERLDFFDRLRTGAGVGFLVGFFAGTFTSFVNILFYYLGGGRERAATALGLPLTPINLEGVLSEMHARFLIWVVLISFSTLSGLVSAIFPIGKAQDHIHIPEK